MHNAIDSRFHFVCIHDFVKENTRVGPQLARICVRCASYHIICVGICYHIGNRKCGANMSSIFSYHRTHSIRMWSNRLLLPSKCEHAQHETDKVFLRIFFFVWFDAVVVMVWFFSAMMSPVAKSSLSLSLFPLFFSTICNRRSVWMYAGARVSTKLRILPDPEWPTMLRAVANRVHADVQKAVQCVVWLIILQSVVFHSEQDEETKLKSQRHIVFA